MRRLQDGDFLTRQSPSQWLSAAFKFKSMEIDIAQNSGQLENYLRDKIQIEKRINIRIYPNFVNPYSVSVMSVM